MANDEYGLFWNSENGDRLYDADSFSNWLKKFFTTGVFQNDCEVTALGSMVVSMGTGYANLEGKVKFFEQDTNFTIDVASSTYPRIDTIVIERNDIDREITAKYVVGQYSGDNPQPTAPVRDGGIYQIVVAQIYVGAGVTSITQADITDKRPDSNVCGWVTGTVEEIDLQQILSQSQAKFEEWFETIQDILDEDTAGHLQNEIQSTTLSFTIQTNDWDDGSYTLENSGITQFSNQEWLLDENATLSEVKAWGKAAIVDGGQQAGSATIIARGTVPNIAIPIRVILRGIK